MARSGTDEQGFTRCFDDFFGDAVELLHDADARDLGKEALDEAEVAVGDAGDGYDGFGVGEVLWIDTQAELLPAVRDDEGEFFGAEISVMGEADAAVKLRVAGEAFFDAGHADKDDPRGVAVIVVPDLLERRRFEPVGLVDDEEFGQASGSRAAVLDDVDVAFPGVSAAQEILWQVRGCCRWISRGLMVTVGVLNAVLASNTRAGTGSALV